MKRIFLFSIVFCMSFIVNAQTTFSEAIVIDNSLEGASSAHCADINGDTYLDVIATAYGDNKLVWFANDGEGNFGEMNIISGDVEGAWTATEADLNDDNTVDVICAASEGSKVMWFENDGVGNFTAHLLSDEVSIPSDVQTADIDLDNDLDVVVADFDASLILWFENDGNGNFEKHILAYVVQSISSIRIADIDLDNDPDVVSASSGDNTVAWFENDGQGDFTKHIIDDNVEYIWAVEVGDVNGDTYPDVFVSLMSFYKGNSSIAWYANDGAGNFGTEQSVDTDIVNPRSIFASDFDNDGDNDFVIASEYGTIAFFENSGEGSFQNSITITTDAPDAMFVTGGDLDSDSDLDVLSVSMDNNTVIWFQNDLIDITADIEAPANFDYYPNPASAKLNIQATNLRSLEILSLDGVLLENTSKIKSSQFALDVSDIPSGIYILRVNIKGKIYHKKLIVK